MKLSRLPHYGWCLLATLVLMLLAAAGQFALDYSRVQRIYALGDPEHLFLPLKCKPRGPKWLSKVAERLGCEEFFRTRVTEVRFLNKSFRDEHLRQLPNTADIESIFLDGTGITDQALASVGELPRLHALFLDNREIGPGVSSLLRNCPNIQSLICHHCSLVPDALVGLPPFPALRRVCLMDVPFRSQDRLFFTGSPDLNVLILRGTAVDDDIVGLASSFDGLEIIDLTRTRVGDTIAFELGSHEGLTEIKLSETAITDRGAQALSTLAQLECLELSRTAVTDQGTIDFDQLQSLVTLDLSNTRISDETLRRVLNLPNLVRCDLSGTNITDSGLDALVDGLPPEREICIGETAITHEAVARVLEQHPRWKFVRKRLFDDSEREER